ncbi:MAG: zinc-ribbon domain-containing protein [Candidatus Odinarchaeota archaeon]
MFRRSVFILTLVLSIVVSLVITILTGMFFFLIIGLMPFLYSFREHGKTVKPSNSFLNQESEPLFYCPHCGARVYKRFVFCPRCGRKLSE